MNIIPLVGIDDIILGSTKEEIANLLGEPDAKEQDEWPDDTLSETWSYQDMGLELNFDSEDGYRLTTITTTSSGASLEGINPIGLEEKKFVELLPLVKLDDDFEENGKGYIYPEKEISFWVLDGVVVNLTLFPEYDKTGNIPIWPNIKS